MEAEGFEAKLLASGDLSILGIYVGGKTCGSCSTAIENENVAGFTVNELVQWILTKPVRVQSY